MTREETLQHTEIHLLVEALAMLYGYDFRHYSRASLGRRVRRIAERHAEGNVGTLLKRVLYEPAFFPQMLSELTVTTSEMFRDPWVFRFLVDDVFPVLATYPSIRIWHAGCGSGEEVFSLAILLQEADLLAKSRIYATDINPAALAAASRGIFALESVATYTDNYYRAGGRHSFSDYYQAGPSGVLMDPRLREGVVFAEHNLFSDDVFSEVHLILCRNVMIYFDDDAQDRAVRLFARSLVFKGFLVLGSKESLLSTSQRTLFTELWAGIRVFQKTRTHGDEIH